MNAGPNHRNPEHSLVSSFPGPVLSIPGAEVHDAGPWTRCKVGKPLSSVTVVKSG